jgi:hypothetical protein
MGQGDYKVVLTGSILEGFERPQVMAAAVKLFKCTEEQAQRFLQGNPTPLKREMDAATAQRYEQQLTKHGIACRLEPTEPPQPVLELSLDAEPNASSEVDSVPASAPSPREDEHGSGSSLSLASSPALAASSPTTNAQGAGEESGFRCPKCGTPQEKGDECIKCGIIFSRYQEPQPESVEQTSQDQDYDLDEMDELALYVGENYDKYRYKFTQLYQNEGKYQLQWNWPAFLATFPWLIYRKMYPWAGALLIIMTIAPSILQLPIGIAMGLMGDYLYYRYAMQRLQKISASGSERRDAIIAAGGTHSMLVTIGVTFLAGALMSIIIYLFFLPPEVEEALQRNGETRQEIEQAGKSKTKQKMVSLKILLGLQKSAQAYTQQSFDMPKNLEELRKMLGAAPDSTADEWGTQMDMEVDGNTLIFYSAGEDKTFDTEDDVVFETRI